MQTFHITGVLDDGSFRGPHVPKDARKAISVPRGQGFTVLVDVVRQDGTPLVQIDYSIVFTVRRKSFDEQNVIRKTGVVLPQPGRWQFSTTAAEMRNIQGGRYVFDVWVTRTSSSVRTQVVPLSTFTILGGMP